MSVCPQKSVLPNKFVVVVVVVFLVPYLYICVAVSLFTLLLSRGFVVVVAN